MEIHARNYPNIPHSAPVHKKFKKTAKYSRFSCFFYAIIFMIVVAGYASETLLQRATHYLLFYRSFWFQGDQEQHLWISEFFIIVPILIF